MPMSDAETLRGARDRAAALLDAALPCAPDAETTLLCVGLEGGLDPLPAMSAGGPVRYALKTWACVTDGRRWSFGAGPAIVVPDAVAREVRRGAELGDVIDACAGTAVRSSRGAWGLLTRDLVGRREAFRLAIVSALAPFYNPALYAE
jgi:non-canonical (house-cleaning) NTP pyrophosphatase